MPKKRDGVSEEEAIRQARKALGDEKIAELQALPPEGREAILRALRSLVAAPQGPPQNRGGRPLGSGKMDLTPAFRRMAELQDADPALKDRPAAQRISEEMRPGLNVSHETLRKEYRKVKTKFLAEIHEQKRPRLRHAASVVVGASPPAGVSAADHFWSLASAVEEARRAFLGPSIEELKAAVLGPSITELALGPSVAELAAIAGPIKLPGTASEMAERLLGSPGSGWLAEQERIGQMTASSYIENAIRGLDILLLGKKPPG